MRLLAESLGKFRHAEAVNRPVEQHEGLNTGDPVLDNSVLSLKGLHGSESGKVINTFRDLIVNVYFPEKTLQRLNVLPI